MRRLVFALNTAISLLVSLRIACAGELIVPKTTSPDGNYAIYAIDSGKEYLPATLEICRLSDNKPKLRLDVGGWLPTAAMYGSADAYGDADSNSIFVVWNSTSSEVALMVRDGRRTGSLKIAKKKDDSFVEVNVPDFESPIERVLRLRRDGRYIYEFPERWTDEHTLLIRLRFDDLDLADSKTYQFDCTLVYDVANDKTSNLKILSKTLEEG